MKIAYTILFVLFLIALLRLCAWADTGMRGESPVIQNPNPFSIEP